MRTTAGRNTPRGRGRWIAALAAGAVSATVLGTASPAAAERGSYPDPADATASLNDLRRVTVAHNDGALRLRVRVTDLRATSDGGSAGLTVWVDTDRGTPGPDLRLGTGLQSGTDYQLVRTAGWKPSSEALTCPYSVRLRPAKDVVDLRISRRCLGAATDEVRVAVRMDDHDDPSHPVRDWLGARRSLTPWLERG
ncbi:hypothetical protein GHK92_10810 [Nocardioides sp. dk4132]|uniref:hypothetical protein n=1 Tax=unclassified Nocardioides TaxID=2615069 RepID=UPI0012972B14|nr:MULTISPECIES: hypothetical protein [unclassified Nocardioides]MQW76368.1 hypothetical protein [Nocardioides sp. dk4132]QGA07355.1 hypothetical protein GFH29_08110 [Nocardioides sp. dk884]